MRPVVAVDIDGTLADYHGHFIRFMANYMGDHGAIFRGSVEMYDGEDNFRDYCAHLFKCDSAMYRQVKLAYRQGGMKRTMPILNHAKWLMKKLDKWDAEIWVTTTRPYLSLDNVVPDTLHWLDKHQIAFDHMLFDEDKYAILAERVEKERVIAILDDLPEMYDAASEAFGPEVPILVRGKFNTAVKRPNAATLRHCGDIILGRLADWDRDD